MFLSHQVFDNALLGDCPPANWPLPSIVSARLRRVLIGDLLHAGGSASTKPHEARGLTDAQQLKGVFRVLAERRIAATLNI